MSKLNTLLFPIFTNIKTLFDLQNERIGDLTELNTTAKNNIVEAINEVILTGGEGGQPIPVSTAAGMTDTDAIYLYTGSGSPFTVAEGVDNISINTIDTGTYSAYLCNMEDGDVTNLTYPCSWKIE